MQPCERTRNESRDSENHQYLLAFPALRSAHPRAGQRNTQQSQLTPGLTPILRGGKAAVAAKLAHFQTDLLLWELSGAAIEAITTSINNAPARCKVIIVPLRGAVSRVHLSDMAFALRHPSYEIDMAGAWSTPAEKADVVRWVQATRDSLQPFAHGVYINQLGDTSDQLVRAGYGPNYPRLVEIKKKYDPKNLLRLNQNISPN